MCTAGKANVYFDWGKAAMLLFPIKGKPAAFREAVVNPIKDRKITVLRR